MTDADRFPFDQTRWVHICFGGKVYRYGGFTFEIHPYCGPHPLKKNGDPVAHIPARFWPVWERFKALDVAEKQRLEVRP